ALGTVRNMLADTLPDPRPAETLREALERAFTVGSFADPTAEQHLANILGEHLIPAAGWQLIADASGEPLPALFVAPTARLAQVPW
ncbi:CHAT domain-containing protein, partial [Mycobacterium sp. ITM-2017-0098]